MIRFGIVVSFVAQVLWGQSAGAQAIAQVSMPDPTYHAILHFEFTHSLRIPDYHVTVDLNNLDSPSSDSVEVHTVSEPMPGHGWHETAVDTSFRIGRAEFEQLVKAVNAITVPKVALTTSLSIGTDGYTCMIRFGDLQNSVSIEVWSPSEKNGPLGYYVACRQFLEIGGLDPDEIFGR